MEPPPPMNGIEIHLDFPSRLSLVHPRTRHVPAANSGDPVWSLTGNIGELLIVWNVLQPELGAAYSKYLNLLKAELLLQIKPCPISDHTAGTVPDQKQVIRGCAVLTDHLSRVQDPPGSFMVQIVADLSKLAAQQADK